MAEDKIVANPTIFDTAWQEMMNNALLRVRRFNRCSFSFFCKTLNGYFWLQVLVTISFIGRDKKTVKFCKLKHFQAKTNGEFWELSFVNVLYC